MIPTTGFIAYNTEPMENDHLWKFQVNLTDCSRHVIFKHQKNDRWTIVKLYPHKNYFWAPDGDRMRNFLMTGETL